MDLMIADDTGYELGYLTALTAFDLDTTSTYDFQATMSLSAYRAAGYGWNYRIYCDGTEFGGMIQDVKAISADSEVLLMGDTWRGMLRKKIISPPSGEDYRIVSGEANSVISSLIGNQLGTLFAVSDEDSGFSLSSYQFERYTTLEEGLAAALKTVGARLDLKYSGRKKKVIVSAQPVVTHDEYTDDQLQLTARSYRRGINHLICLGQGELAERTVLHLYVDEDGTVGTKQYYTGLEERVEVYDYSSAESTDVLREYGVKRLKELMNYDTATLDVENVTDMSVGDIVCATESLTGQTVEEEVTGLTLTISGGELKITYKIGDDSE